MEASAAAAAASASIGGVFPRRGPVGRRTEGPRPATLGFSDEGHLRYYASVRCWSKKEKRTEKLVKGLRRDLVEFSSMGFGDGMVGEVEGKMISEAADVLLAQLTQLRAEAKEMKIRKKQEKAAMKAAKRKDIDDSSSSSESSDSECECKTTLKMTSIKTPEIHRDPVAPKLLTTAAIDQVGVNTTTTTTLNLESNIEAVVKAVESKIEVCMGGKCKKSGATELLAEFDRKVGIEGAVIGCKCMGKCKEGPNVRVVNPSNAEVIKVVKGPLCIGVGLEDVASIVANFFGENEDVGFAA